MVKPVKPNLNYCMKRRFLGLHRLAEDIGWSDEMDSSKFQLLEFMSRAQLIAAKEELQSQRGEGN